MKKLLFVMFAFLCVFALAGCEYLPQNPDNGGEQPGEGEEQPGEGEEQPGEGEEQPGEGEDPFEELKKKYEEELVNYFKENIPETVTESLDLIEEYEFEDLSWAYLTWTSSQGRTINKSGKYTQNLFDEEITLTATVSADELSEEFTIEVVVKTEGKEDLEAYKEIIEGYLPDYVYKDFELVDRDGTFKSYNMFGNITYESTRPEVLTSEGKYVNENKEDQEVEFKYTVLINGITIEGSKMITVEGDKDDYYIEQAQLWLEARYGNVASVYDTLDLPVTDDKDRVTFIWQSSDQTVIANSGVLNTFEPNKEATMTATIKCNDKEGTWEKKFKTYTTESVLEFMSERMHRDVVQQYKMVVYAYTADNYGYIPFYVQDTALKDMVVSTNFSNPTENTYLTKEHDTNVKKLKIETGLIPWNNMGRTQTKKTGTYCITVHDTGDAIHSAEWWNELEKTNDARQTSWNFTVGDTAIYQHVPLDEVAWHAGDGSTRWGMNDTGVKYDGPNPEITIGEDGYLYINGKKSKIPVPLISGANNASMNGKYATEITPAGLYTCLGENGNYHMASVYASNYSQNVGRYYVCTRGGNRNSIGIETCINQGVDYNQVMRNCANLVANLLVYFDIPTDAVLQHRNFSGKLCPQVMIENDTWGDFKNVVENEYIIKKYFEGIKFEYTSNNPDILGNDGKILKAVTEDTTVSYNVTVSYNGQSKTFTKTTVIKPIK